MWFGVLGFVCFAVAVVLFLKGEDNGIDKLSEVMQRQNEKLDKIELRYSKIIESYTAQESANKVLHDMLAKFDERVGRLEIRAETTPIQVPSFPKSLKLEMDKPIQMQPIQVIYRRAEPKPPPLPKQQHKHTEVNQ